MRILHVTPELPFAPGGSGGSARQFHLLRRLVERGHDVTVAAVATAAQEERGRPALAGAGIAAELAVRPPARGRETAAALVRRPALLPQAVTRPLLAWQVGVFWAALRPLVARVVAERRPDVVAVEHDWAAAWCADLPPGLPVVLTLENVTSRYYAARAAAAGGGVRRAALAFEARRWERFDARRLPGHDALVAVSDDDAAEVRRLAPGTRVEVVPNGVATDEVVPATGPPSPGTLVFTGTMSYPPNAEAARWLVGSAWPAIRRARPGARLLLVGRDPPEAVRRLAAEEGVEVTGAVPDVAPYLARAEAVVVPLRSGGGTKTKVLEAMAAGRPLVTTPVGAEGIAARDGEHVLVADDPDAFARATVRLLEEADLRARLATAARALVEERYDWRALGDRLEALLVELAPAP